MSKERLTAFSDGVLAIIITIMVLELKVPHGSDWAALKGLAPIFSSYVLSFVYIAIYWNNHHHMMHMVDSVSGAILWANMHLLFWLSLIPFATAWMGENQFAQLPTLVYGISLLMPALAYLALQTVIIRSQGPQSPLARAVGRDWQGLLSPLVYTVAIASTWISPWIALAIYATVALVWLVPDPRIERAIAKK